MNRTASGDVIGRGWGMLSLVVVVVVGTALIVSEALARRVQVAPPVMLLVSGVLLGFAPALRGVELPPGIVLLLFLPVLLYAESLNISLREIRSNLRTILLNSTVLVMITAAAVAGAAHASGLPWSAAWVLGAAVAPTDATAVGVLVRSLPRRTVTVLRAESLVNDGTALVIYAIAVGIAAGGQHLTVPYVGWLLLLEYGGGALAGVAAAWSGVRIRRRLQDPVQESVAVLLLPFLAYLLADVMRASGVLAVVVCGLIMSQAGPHLGRALTRLQVIPFLSLATYLINGALFLFVGLEVRRAVHGLTSVALIQGLIAVAVVSAAVLGTRFVWLFTVPYVIRALDRRPQQRARRVGPRPRVVIGLAGFRGAVSMAVALAVPAVLASGEPFPERDLIVFVTTGVVVTTLVVPALVLPAVIRWAQLPPDTAVAEEVHLAQTVSVEEALAALPGIAAEQHARPEVADRVQAEYEEHLELLNSDGGGTDEAPAVRDEHQDTVLRAALIAHKQDTVLRLRDEGRIDDTVLHQLQARLDIEEVRLVQPRAPE